MAYDLSIYAIACWTKVDELENLLTNHKLVLAKSGNMKVEEKDEPLITFKLFQGKAQSKI